VVERGQVSGGMRLITIIISLTNPIIYNALSFRIMRSEAMLARRTSTFDSE
jgi:hypothetical protein